MGDVVSLVEKAAPPLQQATASLYSLPGMLPCQLTSAGMGDVVSLVEKAEDAIQAEEAAELTKKMMTGG